MQKSLTGLNLCCSDVSGASPGCCLLLVRAPSFVVTYGRTEFRTERDEYLNEKNGAMLKLMQNLSFTCR